MTAGEAEVNFARPTTTPFGQLVAEAFDSGMAPRQWVALSKDPDRDLHVFLHETWEAEVWPKFVEAYRAMHG